MLFGFIGLGNMGAPLARNILKAGEELMVFSRSEDRKTSFAGIGAHVAATLSELASCDAICTCLPLPHHVTDLMLGTEEKEGLYACMKPGSIHIEFSTIDPATANRMVEAAQMRGIAYVQCTVGKTPAMAARCEEPLFIGGNREAISKLMPIFEKIGLPRDVDTVNASCAVKLLSNLIGMANLAILAEGMRIGQLAGMDPHQLVELLQDTGARSFQLDVRGPWIAAEDFNARFGVELAAKDMRLGCAMSRDWGFAPAMMEQARNFFQLAATEGHAEEDCCAVFKIIH